MQTDAERDTLQRCLQAVATGNLFDDAEFGTLFGMERAELGAILARWPSLDETDPQVDVAVTNTLANLIGYPHGRDLTKVVGASSVELQQLLNRWRVRTWSRLPTVRKIARARETRGLTHADVAARLGITLPSYWDLETHVDEARGCLSLRQVVTLAEVLCLTPLDLLDDASTVPPSRQLLPEDIAAALRQRIIDDQVDAASLGDQLGWDIADVLETPGRMWERWSVDALRDVCSPLALDWRALFLTSLRAQEQR